MTTDTERELSLCPTMTSALGIIATNTEHHHQQLKLEWSFARGSIVGDGL